MASATDHFAPSEETLKGGNADVYFQRSLDILDREQLDPHATIEVFARRQSVLCGMREVHALLQRVLSTQSEVWSLAEGSLIDNLEVVLRISGPYREYGLYETAMLGMLSSGTGWASAAAECVEAAAGLPVICFGARHVHPDVSARMEYAAMVGGCSGCATTAGASILGRQPSGTLPHALILVMGDTLDAMSAFDRHVPDEVPRIALVDTFLDEPEESVRVARAMGDRLRGVRLDTPAELGGVTAELVNEVRARLDGEGHQQVKIVVSGGVDVERIRYFRDAGAPVDSFGIGSAISGARPVDFTADIKEVDGRPVAKRGRVPGTVENRRLAPMPRT